MVKLTILFSITCALFPILAAAQGIDSLRSIDSLNFTIPNEDDLIDHVVTTEVEPTVEALQLYLDDSIESVSNRVTPSRVTITSRVVANPDALMDPNYQNDNYRGSSIKTSNTLSAKTTDFECYLVQSKDAGEPIFFDRIGAALSLRRSQRLVEDLKLSRLALGDYSLNIGNGLILSRGYPNYPSEQSTRNSIGSGEVIKPYHSISAYRFFRGAAAEFQYHSLSFSMFFSDRLIDASIDSNEIVSLPPSGYHRTTTELDKRNAARQTLDGAVFSVTDFDTSHAGFSAGIAAYKMKFDQPVAYDTNSFNFFGQHHSMMSIFATSSIISLDIAAEYGRTISDIGNADAITVTAQYDASPAVRLTANYHDLAANFYSPFGSTFGLYTDDAQNEQGYYLGASYTPSPLLSFFWFGIYGKNRLEPSDEQSFQNTFDSRIGTMIVIGNQTIKAQVQFVRQWDMVSATDSLLQIKLFPQLTWLYDITSAFRTKAQLKYLLRNNSTMTENGYLFGIGARYEPIEQFFIGIGMSFYRTDSYAVRFYSSDPDLPGDASFTALYGNGSRFGLACRYMPSKSISVAATIAETLFSYPIGADLTKKTSVGFQLTAGF